MDTGIERIYAPASLDGGEGLLAIVIRPRFIFQPGTTFVTDPKQPQQLAHMLRPAGDVVRPHTHAAVPRSFTHTQEVLVIQSGRVVVNLFTSQKEFVKSLRLASGDVIMFVSGGHSLVMRTAVEMIEVKQGPYSGKSDKVPWDDVYLEQCPFCDKIHNSADHDTDWQFVCCGHGLLKWTKKPDGTLGLVNIPDKE